MRNTRFQRWTKAAIRPARTDGYVYYVRLKTPLGLFYKLGFTSLGSVEERLAFQGKGDEDLVDKVLFFVYLKDGYDVETALHQHFRPRKAFSNVQSDPNLPLYRNGQSELYIDDILDYDSGYHIDQAHATQRGICHAKQARVDKVVQGMRGARPVDSDVATVLAAVEGPVTWLMRAYAKFCMVFASEAERVRHAARQGRHYQAKLPKSEAIEAILERLSDAHFLQTLDEANKRKERVQALLREAGLAELPNRPRT